MRPVLLGMNNPASADPRHALYPHPVGCAGWNLAKYSGLSHEEYLEKFERRNLIDRTEWNAKYAISRSDLLMRELQGRRVVLLGVPVAAIMRYPYLRRLFSWTPMPNGGWWARCPHPSGLCRDWNDPVVRACAEIFLQELALSSD